MDRGTITRIKGLSQIRRLPRLGKIRLGVKKLTSGGKEYPAEVDYFVCPPEVQAFYGERPKEIDIMFPVEDESKCFPQAYKAYVANGLRCKGDGERALRRVADLVWKGKAQDDASSRVIGQPEDDPNGLAEIGCPCALLDSGECRQSGNLMVLLPKVSMGGIYQIDTGSINNIIEVNSAIDYVRCLLGRIALVPLVLSRHPEQIEYEGKKATHYLLQCVLNANLEQVARLRDDARMILRDVERLALPAPVEDGPDPTGPPPTLREEGPPGLRSPAAPPTHVERKQEQRAMAFEDWLLAFAEADSIEAVEKLVQACGPFYKASPGEVQVKIRMAKDKRLTELRRTTSTPTS